MEVLQRAVAYAVALLMAFALGWFWNEHVHADLIIRLQQDRREAVLTAKAAAEMSSSSLKFATGYQTTLDVCLSRNGLPVDVVLPPKKGSI